MTDLQGNHISADLPCFDCGYNLRGLQSDGRCPECGGSIAEAVFYHRTKSLDPRTATIVRWGINGLLLSLAWPMIELLLAIWVNTRAAYLALGAGAILCAASWWAVATRVPAIPTHRSLEWIRPAIRCASAAFIAMFLVQWIEGRPLLVGPTLLAMTAAVGLTCRYIEALARDLGEWQLAAYAAFAKWSVTTPLGGCAGAVILVSTVKLESLETIAGLAVVFFGLLLMGGWIVACIVLYEARQVVLARQRPTPYRWPA